MSWPAIRSDADILRALVIGIALCWSVAFVVIALVYELELYADGAMFSYAVAVQDVWAFHWHNISGRMSVFFLSLLPAEIYVGLSGNPGAGIVVYGLLFYVAPLAGLIGTFAADRSRGRVIFVYACCSTALLCPLIFGFPTEMWLAHALFWPTLAVSHYAKPTAAGDGARLRHDARRSLSPMKARWCCWSPSLRHWRCAACAMRFFCARQSSSSWFWRCRPPSRLLLPPDDYYADVFVRAALHFFDPSIFEVGVVIVLLCRARWLRRFTPAVCAAVSGQGLSLCRSRRSDRARHLLAVVRPFDPREQPLLSANCAGDADADVRCTGSAPRALPRWTASPCRCRGWSGQ